MDVSIKELKELKPLLERYVAAYEKAVKNSIQTGATKTMLAMETALAAVEKQTRGSKEIDLTVISYKKLLRAVFDRAKELSCLKLD